MSDEPTKPIKPEPIWSARAKGYCVECYDFISGKKSNPPAEDEESKLLSFEIKKPS